MDGSTAGGDREGRPMSLSEVSNILWRERRLLDLLVFKLEEERFVLESGRMRWLTHATREIEKVLEEINRIELERAMAVADTSRELRTSDAVQQASSVVDRVEKAINEIRNSVQELRAAKNG